MTVIPVTGGLFICSHCGSRWAGSWRGDPNLMTCLYCEKPMKEEKHGACKDCPGCSDPHCGCTSCQGRCAL